MSDDLLNLGNDLDKAKDQMGTIIELMTEISESQQVIEERVQTTVVIQDKSSAEYVELMDQIKVDALDEAETVAEAHCAKKGNVADGNDCCADCTKPRFRVPTAEMCRDFGCSSGCGYTLSVCDKTGKLVGPCVTSCTTSSKFGTSKRPACQVKSGRWAYCDCPTVECTCPPGVKLGEDGKTCTKAGLLQVGFAPLGAKQLPIQKKTDVAGPKSGASLLQVLGSMLR